jgi:hypothetical protein
MRNSDSGAAKDAKNEMILDRMNRIYKMVAGKAGISVAIRRGG